MNTNQKLPSDALTSRPKPVRAALIAVAAVAVIAAGGTGAYAFNQAQTAVSTPTPTATPYLMTLTQDELDSVEAGAEQQQTIIAADEKAAADAQAAADAAAAQQAAADQETDTPAGLPAGSVVPSIPGTTSPDTTKCASGTASDNADGIAICD